MCLGTLLLSQCFRQTRKVRNTSCYGLSTKYIEIWIVGCAFDHCRRIVAAPNYYVMPVTMRGQIGSGLVTKYNLGCKHYVRCLQILKQRHSRMHSELFHIGCYMLQNWYLCILNLERVCLTSGTVDVIMFSCRALSCCFCWTGSEQNRSNCIHLGFAGWSFA